jgi:transposase
VNKRFRVCDLNQVFLLPPCLQDWLPQDHLARFITDVSHELDLSAIYAEYERKDGRGLSAYHPLLLTRLLLYGYAIGVTSSRRIERATHDDLAFRYLAADQHPDHDTIAAFRADHLNTLAGLFVQALQLCQKAGLVKLGNVAIDGTKMMANASLHRSVSYSKLTQSEQFWKETVEKLLTAAEQTDREEDQKWGAGQRGDELPAGLADAKSRLERLRRAKQELAEEARQQLEEAEKHFTPRPPGRPCKDTPAKQKEDVQQRQRAKARLRRARRNAVEPERQYNFVDPDSRVMLDNARKCYTQAYNAQLAADGYAQVIVAAELTQQTVDRQQLIPLVEAVKKATGLRPEAITADAGYWDSVSLRDERLNGIEVLVSPDSKPLAPDAVLPPTVPHTEEARRMREKLATEAGKALYKMRKAIVEPVFGQIKEVRSLRRFRLRGFNHASGEWKLICATHNLLKLFRYRTALRPVLI